MTQHDERDDAMSLRHSVMCMHRHHVTDITPIESVAWRAREWRRLGAQRVLCKALRLLPSEVEVRAPWPGAVHADPGTPHPPLRVPAARSQAPLSIPQKSTTDPYGVAPMMHSVTSSTSQTSVESLHPLAEDERRREQRDRDGGSIVTDVIVAVISALIGVLD